MNQITTLNVMIIQKFVILFVVIMFINSCTTPEKHMEEETVYRKELLAKLYKTRSIDSLQILLQQFIKDDNNIGQMLCYKQIGLRQRESSRFSEAIGSHQQNLDLALQLKDTIEIVQAFNNLGTDFRRIGAQGEASDYHYQALHYAEAYSGIDTPTG